MGNDNEIEIGLDLLKRGPLHPSLRSIGGNNADMSKYGIENLKRACIWIVSLGVELTYDLRDGKLSWGEAAALFDNILDLRPVLQSIKMVSKEVADLSLLEQEELNKYIYENLPARKRHKIKFSPYIVGELIHKSLDIVVRIASFATTMSTLIKS